MAQYIKNANIFGRIGSGIGQGLAEQIPKEIERNRLSSGLQAFEQEHQNLTPMQQLARLSAIPGITPQTIQSFSDLAKQQQQRASFERAAGRGAPPMPQASPGIQDIQFGQSQQRAQVPQQQQPPPQQPGVTQRLAEQPYQPQPQIVTEQPIAEKLLPRLPWTPQQRNERISQYGRQGFTPDQSQQLASDDEARDLAEPGVYEKRLAQQESTQKSAREELDRQLQQKLQKGKEGIFDDITGEWKTNLERSMERDLRLHPDMSVTDAANKWSKEALELAEAKTQFAKTAATTGVESLGKGKQTLDKLKTYSEIFKRTGNQKEYKNLLISQMDLSPQGASYVAYDLSPNVKSYIPKIKSSAKTHPQENAVKVATELGDKITPQDSILAIVRNIKDHDPFFDETAFFGQLREDMHDLGLTNTQITEIAEGEDAKKRTWGDILVFPWFGRS